MKGTYAAGSCADVPTALSYIGKGATVPAPAYDIATCLVPNFIGTLPVDPKAESGGCTPLAMTSPTSDYSTCYTIIKDSTSGRITITAPNTEVITPDIFVTR